MLDLYLLHFASPLAGTRDLLARNDLPEYDCQLFHFVVKAQKFFLHVPIMIPCSR